MAVVVRRELIIGATRVGVVEFRGGSSRDLIDLAESEGLNVVDGLLRGNTGDADAGEAAIQLTEDTEYEYSITCEGSFVVALHPSEVWDGLEVLALSGRLKPRRWVGTVNLTIEFDIGQICIPVEVRARKLNYRSDYRWMLTGISERLVDLVMRAFSPSEMAAFASSSTMADPTTLYQRFAALAAHLRLPEVQAALAQIDRNPDRRYDERFEQRAVGRGRHSTSLHRELGRGGRSASRVRVNDIEVSLPRTVRSRWFAEDSDTPANRFIRFILEDWRAIATAVHDVLMNSSTSTEKGAGARGLLEASSVIADLDEWLAGPMLGTTTPLAPNEFPAQVIQNRAGYRELYAHWLQTLLAFELSWSRDERAPAGTRDVAQAYETWCFLELLAILERIARVSTDVRAAVRASAGGLEVDLSSGRQFSVITEEFGPALALTLFYNRSHTRSADTSWSLQMRPDITLLVTPVDDPDHDVVLHFDAKYRIDQVGRGWDDSVSERGAAAPAGDAKRDDLIKMHAYRDAIRRSVGSYVLYPGAALDRGPAYQVYGELVPGVGAFPFRPSETGAALCSHVDGVEDFLKSLLEHISQRQTRRFRADYWARRAYSEAPADQRPSNSVLARPPADVSVLVGYVRSAEYMQWIMDEEIYLLRADQNRRGAVSYDSELLRPDLVVLYGPDGLIATLRPSGRIEVVTGADLAARGYPDADSTQGRSYFGIRHMGRSVQHVDRLQLARISASIEPPGAPFLVPLAAIMATF